METTEHQNPPVVGYANGPIAPAPQEKAYALYSPGAVGLATFFGTPVAGSAILAMNYRRLGLPALAVKALLLGFAGTAALVALALVLPTSTPSTVTGIAAIICMVKLAEALQGQVFQTHKAAGGKVASMWKATGVGLIGLLVVGAIMVAIVMATTPAAPKRLAVGNGEILYSGSATVADAQALGKALTDEGYLKENVSVLLIKNGSGTTLEFVVNADAGKTQSTLDEFTKIAEGAAASVGGKPFTLKLVDPNLNELQTTKIE